MAKKIEITRTTIIGHYMDYVLLNGTKPHNVYQLMISNKLTEDKFYVFFTSFEQLENEIFVEFFNQTLLVLTKDENYENYPSKEKLLSFYYTFFEMLTANRSYVVWALKNHSLNQP